MAIRDRYGCGKVSEVPVDWAARRGRCRGCGAVLGVPADSGPANPPAAMPRDQAPGRFRPPLSPARATEQVGLTPSRARTILKRWNVEGPAGLADLHKATNGGQAKLTLERQAELPTSSRRRRLTAAIYPSATTQAREIERLHVTQTTQSP